MKKIKFGIVGCGVIAPFHVESILAIENVEIAAVCDIVEEKAISFAEKYNVEKYYTDYRQLIDDNNVDIVCVCTPSGAHGEVVVYAANARKHILCEKPIEITKEKLDEIVEVVRSNNVKMQCVFQKRTKEEFIAVKEAIEEGKLGKLVMSDAYMKYYRSQDYYDSAGWRGTWSMDGGGALMNQGIHGIDVLLWIAGEVESVFGRATAQARNIEVEDTAVAVLKFKNGAFGVVEGTTSVYPSQENTFEIHGEKGSIIFGDEGIKEWKVKDNDEEKAPVFGKSEKYESGSDPTSIPKTSHLELIKNLINSIENDMQPLIPPEEGRKAVDLILAIYESARSGKEIWLT